MEVSAPFAATSVDPALDDATAFQEPVAVLAAHVDPELVLMKTWPGLEDASSCAAAISLVPSLDDATDVQPRAPGALVTAHVDPESVLLQIWPGPLLPSFC